MRREHTASEDAMIRWVHGMRVRNVPHHEDMGSVRTACVCLWYDGRACGFFSLCPALHTTTWLRALQDESWLLP